MLKNAFWKKLNVWQVPVGITYQIAIWSVNY